ncbi:MAG: glycine cleavage system aminomethyltransferase GcvT [Eubacteriales bacterium]|nr:glycine cleavage system aminomethyltransferase GcvT [Eubacteriales bacterium]
MDLKTRLYDKHLELGGQMVSYAKYQMPVQYPAGMLAEHMAVREAAGLFDVSHMGEFLLEGDRALEDLQRILSASFLKLAPEHVRYSLLCTESGYCIDDLLVYHLESNRYMLVVNAANHEKDYEHLCKQISPETKLTDISEACGLIALQGPKSKTILEKLIDPELLPSKNYTFKADLELCSARVLISRTGYTGEYGYEIYHDANDSLKLFEAILEAGHDEGLLPCGLGARDTLRLEAGMPLYGHEMSEEINPFEAGLDFAVKFSKPEFIGRDALLEMQEPKRKRVGLKVTSRGVLREEMPIFLPKSDEQVGVTTSGTFSPCLKTGIAMALVDHDKIDLATAFEVEVRGRRIPVEVVSLPFVHGKEVQC